MRFARLTARIRSAHRMLRTTGPLWFRPAPDAPADAVALRRLARKAQLAPWPRALRPLVAVGASVLFVRDVSRGMAVLRQENPPEQVPPDYCARLRRLCLRHGLVPFFAHSFGMARPGAAPVDAYLQPTECAHQITALTGAEAAALLNDKHAFADFCAAHDVRAPVTHAVFRGGRADGGVDAGAVARADAVDTTGTEAEATAHASADTQAADAAPPPGDLYVKPVRGVRGTGITRWVRDNGSYRTLDGAEAAPDWAGLATHIARAAAAWPHGLLVQSAVPPHPGLADLAGGGTPMVRLTTGRWRGGAVEPLMATLQAPAPDTAISQGAPMRVLDVSTGTIRANPAQPDAVLESYLLHLPGLDGRVLPDWPRALESALALHTALPGPVPLVAWDLILSPDGPVLLEGNVGFAPVFEQTFDKQPAAGGALTRLLAEYLP